ncbi:MAG: hypothetical protein QF807_00315 [Candidatus Thalassarchaeaceae archaeon]|jgi:hypothetical protein|nr:hypothetical protein [Candidatus Thalassarchaeaceae archaeon]MDP7042450.1 hypothetical protein [Candidatus Thalassarchaeaceae archaeon]
MAEETKTPTVSGPRCDYPGCEADGEIISRLSPEGYLVATGKKAYSFREAYRRFHYCKEHHDVLMTGVWSRISDDSNKDDDHVAPTAV